MITPRAHHQSAQAVALPQRVYRLPQLRRWKMALLFLLLLLAAIIGVMNLPGHVSPVVAAQWSSSVATLSDNQAAATPKSTQAPSVPPAIQQSNASAALVRINQLAASQYASQADATTWSYSACSAAALTEVMNAYGFAYRIADILHVEAQIGAITPSQGLTTEAGIAATAKLFGFTTKWGHNLSLDQVIATANAGQPVIVSWPPQTYDGGHIVVVTGGTASTVYLADSSKYDRPSVSRTQFATWWRGFSAILTPLSKDVPAGKPTISVAFINQVLAHYNSPAAGQGQALYSLGQQYDIDPAYALAFFFHESSFGTAGMARITHSLGNSRCVQDAACINTSGGDCQAGQSCYAGYASWAEGFAGWYRQMTAYINGSLEYYLSEQWKPLTTLETIISVYAPSSDHNDVSAYISSIQKAVATWRGGKVVVP
jgi:predicted double-glycine peptidase